MILSTSIAIALPFLLGFLLVASILGNDTDTPLLERLGYSFPLGAGILTLQMFLLGLLRIPLTRFNSSIPIALELGVLALWLWRKNILPAPRPAPGLFNELASPDNTTLKKIAFAGLAAWIGIKLGSVFLEAGLRPIYAWDAWANWSAGAKSFFHAQGLLLDLPGQDFFGKSAVARILTYPLHNTLMQVWMSLWIGAFDEVFVKFYSPVYLLSMAALLYSLAVRELGRLSALALLAIILGSPLLSYHAIEVYSDLIIGIYLFFAAACFLKAMRGKTEYWLLTGIFAAEALLTKEEALFFVLPLLLSAFVYLRTAANRERGRFAHVPLLIAPFIAAVPWYSFKLYYGLGLGAGSDRVSTQLTFHPEILGGYFFSLLSLENFSIIIIFLPLLILAGKLTREALHLLFPVACYKTFFFLLYTLTAYHVYFLQGTIFYRNLLTYYPTLCLITMLLLKQYAALIPPVRQQAQLKQKRKR